MTLLGTVMLLGLIPAGAAARTSSVNDKARLTLVGGSGNTLIEEGRSYGSLPGRIRVSLRLNGTTVASGFTLYLSGGSITGHGNGKLNVGRGTYASFAGWLTISRGTGRYRHASGSGNLYGAINRNDDSAIVQAVGHLRY
jgi:hypothetical protein